jgi:hypothetical protein
LKRQQTHKCRPLSKETDKMKDDGGGGGGGGDNNKMNWIIYFSFPKFPFVYSLVTMNKIN